MRNWQALVRARRIWKEGRWVVQAQSEGKTVMIVPGHLAAEAAQWIWTRAVEHASEKWAARTAEVPLDEWQRAMRRLPRQERGGDD